MKKEYEIIQLIQSSNLYSQKKTAVIKKLRRIITNTEGHFIDDCSIRTSFVWGETVEGHSYWSKIYDQIEGRN